MLLKCRRDTPCEKEWLCGAARVLMGKLEQAAGELDRREVTVRTKVKTQDGEETVERQEYEPGGVVDVKNLKLLTGVLKDLRDVCHLLPPGEAREQALKLQLLEQQLEGKRGAGITVTLEGVEEYCG